MATCGLWFDCSIGILTTVGLPSLTSDIFVATSELFLATGVILSSIPSSLSDDTKSSVFNSRIFSSFLLNPNNLPNKNLIPL